VKDAARLAENRTGSKLHGEKGREEAEGAGPRKGWADHFQAGKNGKRFRKNGKEKRGDDSGVVAKK